MTLENHGTPWSDADEQKLSELYPVTDATQLVKEFGRTHEAIKAKARELEIRKNDDWKGTTKAVHTEAMERGAEAERRFEKFAENNGWDWFTNDAFRRCEGIQAGEESARTHDTDSNEKIEKKPEWFVNLRAEVTEGLKSRESNKEFFPDYIVGGREDGPVFVEVKYGSSNLMDVQIDFFEFIRENGFTVYIYRVKPHGEVDFSEWQGGWK